MGERVRGAVDEGRDAGLFGGRDDGPGHGAAAVEVVQGVCAERGGAHGTRGARVRGKVEVGFGDWLLEGVSLQEGEVRVAELECGAEGGGRCGESVSEVAVKVEGAMGMRNLPSLPKEIFMICFWPFSASISSSVNSRREGSSPPSASW